MAYGGNQYGGNRYGGNEYGGAKFGGYKTKKRKKKPTISASGKPRRVKKKMGKPGIDKSYKPTGLAHRSKSRAEARAGKSESYAPKRKVATKMGKPGVDKSYKPTGLAHGTHRKSGVDKSYKPTGLAHRYPRKPKASSAGQAQAATRSNTLPGGKTPRSAAWKADSNPTGAHNKANYGKAKGFGGKAQSVNASIRGDARRMTKPSRKPGRRESTSSGMRRYWNALGGKKAGGNDWYNKAVRRGFGRI